MEASPLHWSTLLALPEVSEYLLREFSPNLESGIGMPIHCALIGRGILQNISVSMVDLESRMSNPNIQAFLKQAYKNDASFDIKKL